MNLRKFIVISMTCFFTFNLPAAEIARYKLDGNAVDAGVNSLNGTVTGNVYGTQDRFGKAASAMLFSGGLIKINHFANYNFGEKLSLSFWMRRDSASNYMGLVNNGLTSKSFDIRMGRENNGTYLFAKSDWSSGATSINSANFITIGQWHHIAYVADKGVVKLYVDGVLQMEKSIAAGNLKVVKAPVIVGSNAYGLTHEPFTGALDDLWFFDHALTESEVKSIHSGAFVPGYGISLSNTSADVVTAGDTLTYQVTLTNESELDSIDVESWAVLTFPTGEDMSLELPVSTTLLPAQSKGLNEISLNVPAWWPNGQYTLRSYIADPSKAKGNIQSSYFTFNKNP